MKRNRTFGLALAAMSVLGLGAATQPEPPRAPVSAGAERSHVTTSKPATTQPVQATRPGRRPEQAEIIENLLRSEGARLIAPQNPQLTDEKEVASTQPEQEQRSRLLLDGTSIVERPGRYALQDGKPTFVFRAGPNEATARTMEILPNQLLEAMEREVRSGHVEFVVSGEVTAYADRNFLFLRKLLRHVGHGNLSP